VTDKETINQLNEEVSKIAESMTTVAKSIAMLGVEGDADALMQTITDENNKVLDRIRKLYNLPPAPGPKV
jgi:division protein CdvB (Snf7/Vps24/ESCRT-III family)